MILVIVTGSLFITSRFHKHESFILQQICVNIGSVSIAYQTHYLGIGHPVQPKIAWPTPTVTLVSFQLIHYQFPLFQDQKKEQKTLWNIITTHREKRILLQVWYEKETWHCLYGLQNAFGISLVVLLANSYLRKMRGVGVGKYIRQVLLSWNWLPSMCYCMNWHNWFVRRVKFNTTS